MSMPWMRLGLEEVVKVFRRLKEWPAKTRSGSHTPSP